ncbi:MAG: cation:proton antiporter [Saprospiraceae bacterium]|nr:cation:proton antiporter [Saprospiraceae bacterium]MDP4701111.1 cation:proton antiporter [Saprospiraceae bacterium]MDP4813483.1 cation:proton antiporter [Saprospiraceae bacterium]MDP4913172.1 cation:proton antiporter [Saprospiraceae bacterium]MDP5048472.1 cation:proton antiporter [Saprospiraceae bacterium]
MSTSIIITLCSLLLLAYLFDVSAPKTKIPTVILLLLLGWGVKNTSIILNIDIPNLEPILPILGTIGLILIVLEGALELELEPSKFEMIKKSTLLALIQMLVISFGLALSFQYFGGSTFKSGLINAIPLAIVSSAIAIPSAKNLLRNEKEFITYESSLSDIFGVIFFNFILANDHLNASSFGMFLLQLLLMIIVSMASTIILSYLLKRINHSIKFIPIILLVILIYSISKVYHMPSLIFILIFGLFIGNIDELKKISWINRMKPENLNQEVHKFKEITTEITFMIRALFFLLFGYLINISELLNMDTALWAFLLTGSIFILRYLVIYLFQLKQNPILFIAPRGLITILLFLSIPSSQQFYMANKSLILQVIILSAFVMMFGLINYKKVPEKV